MARVLVTGCAGFIGSRVAEACLDRGDQVVGVDCFTNHYGIDHKRQHLSRLAPHERFVFREVDIADGCDELVEGVDVVFHFAGQPGVRASWRDQFDAYARHNVVATQRLLESATGAGVGRMVYASSSSVYGNADAYPVVETDTPRPFSPYGVTKLAAEHLCNLYAENYGLSVVSLRFFTVYGPGQRPDMAIHRLFEAALSGDEFVLHGSGEQIRDFTYIDDVVRANLLAADADVKPGLVANIAGGSTSSMNDLIRSIERIAATHIDIARADSARGDVVRTSAAVDVAREQLGWNPAVGLDDGLGSQFEWHRQRRTR